MARSPRRPPVLLLHLAWLCALGCTCVSTFNLDQDKVIKKVGDKNSFFGFSLAMHRQLQPAEKRMLLVGAPRAKALDKQKANITGGLYSCEVTTQTNDCKRVIFDNDVDSTKENKENQWMGVTVRSQGPGGKILACAHRYQKWQFVSQPQETRDIIGRCYVLSQDLTINTASAEDGGSWKFCDGRVRGHERFGSCQQGLSATFTKNYHYLVFGAPGGYNWKGIVRVEQKNTTLEDQGIFDDGPYEVGDESALDATLVPAPPNSYLGFSLDSGYKITKKGQLTIVAGAPRANHSGAVVLLKIDPEFKSRLIDEYTFEGQGLASSFGYDVTVADLNKDGWEDIVVGAPQYFLKDGEVGGAVYVYINREGKWNTVKPIQLNGNKDSMFGLAVENIGDINQDSYEDIAVGAPYDSNGEGKVYIYHGSASGITTKPVQILQANDANVKLFGYSLAGNMDLDKNSYPDVAVGSLSDTLFIYRARPIINIEKSVQITPNEINLTRTNCGERICMEMNACFSFSANPPSYNPRLTLAFSIAVDPEQSKRNMPPRATFLTKSPTDTNKLSGTVELLGQNNRQCIIQKLQLKDGKELKDKLRPIGVEVSVSIQDLKRRRRDSMLPQLVPVLDANNDKTKTQVGFSKEGCGADNICQSNLEMKYKFFYKDPKQDIFHPFQQKNGVPVMSLNDQKDIALEINVTNKNGDDAYEARVQAVFPSYLSYSAYRVKKAGNQQVNCISNQNGSSAYCELGNPFKGGSEVTFYIILSTASMSLDIAEIEVDLNLETTSEQKNLNVVKAKAQVLTELLLSVSGVAKPSQVEFGGEIKGESAVKFEDEIGSLIEYKFRIINLGRPLKFFDTAFLNIQWPKETDNGKWILYLLSTTTEGRKKIPCSPQAEINPNKVSHKSRKKRAPGDEKSSGSTFFRFLDRDKKKYKTLMCGNGTKCVEIRCPLEGLESNAIVLQSRLWNSTFLEEYPSLNYLDIIVKASLHLDNTAHNIFMKNAETQVRVTVFPEKSVAKYSGMPWWIILVAILAGLLLLALLGFLLWKCGFFKKSKKYQYDSSYHKAEYHVQPSDKDRLTADA
ncbi:integrin alpha-6-like [Scleropages formosus]|uniref:Integrin subunit alpha 6 n=1 Tax=Scleropages formosus TaxID=113540 RepID=A0A8C9R011_SCLFO|nr:integrin alpha-6-like [Scleropages formosus]